MKQVFLTVGPPSKDVRMILYSAFGWSLESFMPAFDDFGYRGSLIFREVCAGAKQ